MWDGLKTNSEPPKELLLISSPQVSGLIFGFLNQNFALSMNFPRNIFDRIIPRKYSQRSEKKSAIASEAEELNRAHF